MADINLIAWDESTPLTADQVEKMNRRCKIHKLAALLFDLKCPVYPGDHGQYQLGKHLGSHIYEVIAEYLVDHGVEVDVVHCGECKHLNKKVDCGGFCKCGEVNGGTPTMRVNWGYCDYGEKRDENGS